MYNVPSTKRGEFRLACCKQERETRSEKLETQFSNSTQIKKWPVLLSRGCTAGPLNMELSAILVTAKDASGKGTLERFERQVF